MECKYKINGNSIPQIEISENDYPSKEKIWDRQYECRNFELSSFWQKSVFLFTFLSLCFGGYGALVLQIAEPKDKDLSYIYQYMCGISLLGIVLSVVWIYMMKGSKAWYEVYEKSIYAIENEIFKGSNKEYIEGRFANKMRGDFDLSFLNNKAGAFSPSKINMVIGWIMLFVWSICEFVSFYNFLITAKFFIVAPDWCYSLLSIVIVVIFVFLIPIVIRTFIKSKPLLHKDLHKERNLCKEFSYQAFLPTIREKIDSIVDSRLKDIKKKGFTNVKLGFTEKENDDIKQLLDNELKLLIDDKIYEKIESQRDSIISKIKNIAEECIKSAQKR